jgi:hypothetical protein
LTVQSSAPGLDEIDQQLTLWESQVARVKANLDFLQQTPSYAFISGGLKLTGRTQREIVEPILAARELADQYDMLAGQVARARLLRDSMRRFLPANKLMPPNVTTLREIDRLLNAPCIPLPAAQVALAQRNLLDDPAAKSQLSLRELVDIMIPTFTAARDSVTRYDEVMAALTPVLKSADAQIAVLASRASALDVQAESEVERVRAIFAETRRSALDDPLGVEANLEHVLQEPLRALERRLAAIEQERTGIREELAGAQMRQARATRRSAHDPAQVVDLGDWLSSIAHTLESSEYAAARVGLQRWNESADQVYGAEEQRREQLDLLKALRAMAQRRREHGAVIDANLDAVGLEAEAALRHQPLDLARASQLVQRYQQGVTAL